MNRTIRLYHKSYRHSRRDASILVVLFVFAFILRQLTVIHPYADVYDIYYYWILARNMIAGKGYTVMGEAHDWYLPGYPVIVAISSLLIGDIEFSALLISAILGSLTIPLTFLLVKTVSNEKVALLSSSLVLINPQHITHTSRAISEGMALLFIIVLLYLLILAIREKSTVLLYLCTFVSGALFLTRYPSLIFFPTVIISLLLLRKRISWPSKPIFLGVLVILICFSGIWFLRNYILFGNPFHIEYLFRQEATAAELGGYDQLIMRNITYYFTKGLVLYTLTPIVTVFFIYGLLTSIRKVHVNVIFYIWLFFEFLFVTLWAGTPQPRYFFSAIPALSLFVAYGVNGLYHYIEVKIDRFRFSSLKDVFILSFILSSFISSNYLTMNHNYFLELQYDRIVFRRAATWLNINAPNDSIIVTTKPMLFHYYTNRTCILSSTFFKQPSLFTEKYIYYIFDNLDGEIYEQEINWEQFIRKSVVTFERTTIDKVLYFRDTFPFLYSESYEKNRVVVVYQISLR